MSDGVVIRITGDDSGFKQTIENVGQTGQRALSGIETSAAKATQALNGIATGAGQSLPSMFDAIAASGSSGMEKLIELASKAEIADAQVESLRAKLGETGAALDTAKAAAAGAAEAFGEMQEDLSFLPQEIERLNAAIESGMRSGTMGVEEYSLAKEQIKEYEAALKKIAAELPKQERTNARLAASVKKLSSEYDGLSLKLQNAEIAASTADSKLTEMAQQMVENTDTAAVSLDDFTASGKITGKMSDGLTGTLNTLAQGAFTEVSMKAMQSVRGLDSFGGSTLVASAAARGLQRVLSGVMKFSGGWLALGAAAAYAAYKIYDVTSGAAAAREALKKLDETAKEWRETNVKTSFETSKGLGAFGLEKSDFKIQPARDWMAEVTRVWSDGKKETDDIVKEMVGGFTSGSDEIREGLSDIKKTAVSGGYAGDGFLAELDQDMARLDKIDTEVEKLLKRKKNGLLSEKDQIKLQDLVDEREAISIKYNLEPEGNTGFDKIVQDVEAAMSRGGDPTETFTNAYAAATQGLGAYTDALNAEYDAQYQILSMSGQLFDEQGNKTAELIALQEWYNQKVDEGAKGYDDAIRAAAEQTNAFGEGGVYDETAQKLETIKGLMDAAAGGTNKEATAELANAVKDLDETQVVEMTAALVAMQAAAEQSGEPMNESAQSLLTTLESIKTAAELTTNVFDESLQESLNTMFGENLDSEVLEVYATLNTEGLEAPYKAWAEGEHADILPSIETDSLRTDLDTGMADYVLDINGELKKVDPTTGELTDTDYRVDVDGQIYKVDPTTGKLSFTGYKIGVDGKLKEVDPKTGKLKDTGYKFGVDGEIVEYDPTTGTSSDTTYRIGLDGKISKYDPATGTTEDTEYRVGLDGKIEKYDPTTGISTDTEYLIGVDGKIEKYDPTTGETQDTNYRANIPGQISTLIEAPGLVKPTVALDGEVTVKKVNIEDGEFTNSANPEIEYLAGASNMNEGGDKWGLSSQAENVRAYASAIETLYAAIDSGDSAAIEAAYSAIGSLDGTLATQMVAGGFTDLAQEIANGLALLAAGDESFSAEDALALIETINAVNTILTSPAFGETGAVFADGISDALTTYGWETTATTVASDLSGALTTALASEKAQTYAEGVKAGENLGQGYVDGIGNKIAAAIERARQLAQAAIDSVNRTSENASPSKATRRSGRWFGDGFVLGITDRVQNAVKASRALGMAGLSGLNVGNLHAAAGMSAQSSGASIDYSRLAAAITAGNSSPDSYGFYLDGREMAVAAVEQNRRAANARLRRLALGVGKRK